MEPASSVVRVTSVCRLHGIDPTTTRPTNQLSQALFIKRRSQDKRMGLRQIELVCGLDATGSEQGPVAVSYQRSGKSSNFIQYEELLD